MERLTERDARLGFIDSSTLPSYVVIYERLRKYENKEEDGVIKELPCPVGTIVYEPYRFLNEGAWEIDRHYLRLEDLDKIGKTVFTDEDEAKDFIKEREKEEPNN